jgi:hypothetical protein
MTFQEPPMTIDKSGLKVSQATLTWLTIIIGVVALGGPPITFVIATKVSEERTIGKFSAVEARQDRTEKELETVRARQDRTDERIDGRLYRIEESLNTIKGSLRSMKDGDQHSSAYAAHGS